MEEEEQKFELGWLGSLIIICGWGAVLEEMIFNHHDESDICQRAAQIPDKAYRDVMRMCQLGEFRQLPPSPDD